MNEPAGSAAAYNRSRSAKKDELENYLDIAGIADLIDVTTCSDDVEEYKPAPDIFEVALKKLGIEGADAVAIGDTPYDAEAAGKAKALEAWGADSNLFHQGAAKERIRT
ncbi:HAD hydrolase-like protein [Bradyrhizobium barranii]|uniref:HAD hydrolase-like protein n=1 Tax=Bradyrhizobium barranii TaxID=2992140 RepID=UPI00140A90E8